MKLETERLYIRKLREADYPAYERTLNDIQKTCMGSGENFLKWIISQYDSMDITNNIISFGIFLKENDTFIGYVGAGRHDDLGEPEIFYHLIEDYRGKGYMTEAAKIVTTWALANYDISYIIGTADVDNISSQRVLERCGYNFIENKNLMVHVMNESFHFKYYRFYKEN